ncbi:MAG: hypothetical protein RIF32_19225 [Leptospirales bacterium]|jgi:hypothetical protein
MHDLMEVPSVWREIRISGIKQYQKLLRAAGDAGSADDENLSASERTESLIRSAILIAEPNAIRLFMRRGRNDLYEIVAEIEHTTCSLIGMLEHYDRELARGRKNRADAGTHAPDPQTLEAVYLDGREYVHRELYGYSVPLPRTRDVLLTRENGHGGAN